jgi:hypothetical protein
LSGFSNHGSSAQAHRHLPPANDARLKASLDGELIIPKSVINQSVSHVILPLGQALFTAAYVTIAYGVIKKIR